jgi:competence protein ComEA
VTTSVPPGPPPAPRPEPLGAPADGRDALAAALARWDAARTPGGPGRGQHDPEALTDAPLGGRARASGEEPVGAPPAAGSGAGEGDPGGELATRLVARRAAGAAARHAATAYAATHGHVPAEGDGSRARRWALRGRTALVAAAAVLTVAAGTALVAWPGGGAVEPLTPASPAAAAPDPIAAAASAGAPVDAAPPSSGAAPTVGDGAAPTGVVVHVVGQVVAPGLVTLPAGARVADAVDAAGGPTDEADLSALNLARTVVDGEQLRVPAPGEEVLPPPAAGGTDGTSGASGGAAATGSAVVDLNSADEATLDTLPGIGPALAGRILAWREENGPFTSVDELDEVSGIGPAVLERLRDLVRV